MESMWRRLIARRRIASDLTHLGPVTAMVVLATPTDEEGDAMPMFLIEREFAEKFEPDDASLRRADEYQQAHEIKWLTSFLSADRKKTYCLYECADIDVLRRHAADLGLPADVITEVDELAR